MRGQNLLLAFLLAGCSATSPTPVTPTRIDAGPEAGTADQDAMVEMDARVPTAGDGASTGSPDASSDASTLDARVAAQDADIDSGEDAAVGTFDDHPCPLVDGCGNAQGANCPATPPSGACGDRNDACYYCRGMSKRPFTAAYCVSGSWSLEAAQPCAP